MNTIIDRILALCEHLGLNISSFSNSIGVNQVTMNNYKLGKRKLSLDVVEKITKVYPQVSAEWLLRGVGSMCCTPSSDVNAMFYTQQCDNSNITNQNISGATEASLIKENEMLKKMLEEKERTIQILMSQNK